jgi:hypothetical protein
MIQLNSLFIYSLNSAASGQLQSQHEQKQKQWHNQDKKTKRNWSVIIIYI